MIIHPALRALRDDDTPQRAAQAQIVAAAERWRASPQAAEVLADLDAFATCRTLAECKALAALFEDGDGSAMALARDFAARMSAALAEVPLAHVPLRHFTDGVVSTQLLGRSGNVTLALVAFDGTGLASRPAPLSADFGPSEKWDHILAGSGSGELVERRPGTAAQADLRRRPIALAPGKIICRDAERQSLLISRVEGCLVTLRLLRRRAGAGLTREYSLADGALIHQAAGNPRDSRIELMLALMGRMGRSDAAPLAAAIAREPGSAPLRWQALRECLALDTAAGFQALSGIAADPRDDLHASAAALHRQLTAAHPQLAMLEPCPA